MKKLALATAFLFASSMFVMAQSTASPSSTDQQPSATSPSASPSSTDQQAPSSASPSSTQDQSAQSSSMGSSNEQKIEGCLSQGANGYTLADASGTTYNLTGDTSKLAAHVGEQVEIKGAPSSGSSAASSSASSTGQASSSSPTAGASAAGQNFDVKAVKRVSKSCSTSGATSPSAH